jgi:hypothetical protein
MMSRNDSMSIRHVFSIIWSATPENKQGNKKKKESFTAFMQSERRYSMDHTVLDHIFPLPVHFLEAPNLQKLSLNASQLMQNPCFHPYGVTSPTNAFNQLYLTLTFSRLSSCATTLFHVRSTTASTLIWNRNFDRVSPP